MCNACGSTLILREVLATRKELVSKLVIYCTNTACSNESTFSDSYSAESKSLNARSILGMREIGRGQASLEYFCGLMDMLPPVKTPSYRFHIRRTVEESIAAHLHDLHGIELTETIYIIVTCDGTWCKRDFTATHKNRIVVVMAWETG